MIEYKVPLENQRVVNLDSPHVAIIGDKIKNINGAYAMPDGRYHVLLEDGTEAVVSRIMKGKG